MEGRAMEQQQCTGDHEHHICALADQGQIEAIKEMTSEPQYICVNCGRVADSYDKLCKPAHVDSIMLM